jgi:hypothetical protein
MTVFWYPSVVIPFADVKKAASARAATFEGRKREE